MSMKKQILFFLLVVAFLPSLVFAQKKLNLNLVNRFPLDSVSYDQGRVKYQITGDTIYYEKMSNGILTIYRKISSQGNSAPIFRYKISKKQYFLDFAVYKNQIYILAYYHQLMSFTLKSSAKIVTEEDTNHSISLHFYYDRVYVTDGKIVLTKCYNNAVKNKEDKIYCPYLVLATQDLSPIIENKLQHDAIGLTHLSGVSYYDINYGKILFTDGLSNTAYIYNLQSKKPIASIGNGELLNKGIDSLPFSTKILYNTNGKGVVLKLIKLSKKINFIQYGAFLNDSTVFLVEEIKSKKNVRKRILSFYQKNRNEGKWKFIGKKKFRNKKDFSKSYGIFHFYSANISVTDNKVCFPEMYVPKSKDNVTKIKSYIKNEENPIFCIYEYKITL